MERWYQQPVRVMDDGHLTPPLTPVSRVRLNHYKLLLVHPLSVVTCGSPVTPSRGSVDISGGTPPFPLGSEVTYRCEEGLFPAGDMASTCRSVGGVGTWRPDTSIICRNMTGEHAVMPLAKLILRISQ